jgi:cbb3-type cytochrome oxidase maturation protein
MEVLIYLVPLALALGLGGFLWALKTGQYDDLDGAAWRAIMDDEEEQGLRTGNHSARHPAPGVLGSAIKIELVAQRHCGHFPSARCQAAAFR